MIKLLGLVVFVCCAGVVLGADREFGHPPFRTFTAHDYGEVGQIFAIGAGRVWRLVQGTNQLEPFELKEKSLSDRNVQLIVGSQLSEDYVWICSRPPNASPATGFEVGRLYVSGAYEPLSHAVSFPLGVINSIWDEKVDGKPVAWIAGDYGLMRVFLDRPAFTKRITTS
jgi:hypothetical protein